MDKQRSYKKWVVLFSLLFLISCSGTGKKSAVFFQETRTDHTLIFVKRLTGHPGKAGLIKVTLNGTEIGKLGENERLSAPTEVGPGTLSANFKGFFSVLASPGTAGDTRKFTVNKGEKLFFIIKQDIGMFLKKLRIYPIDQSDFFADD